MPLIYQTSRMSNTQDAHASRSSFDVQQRHVFNHIFLNFLRDIQDKSKTHDPSVRKALKPNYKIFDRRSSDHIDHLRAQVNEELFELLANEDLDILEQPSVLALEIFRDVSVGTIVQKMLNQPGQSNDADTLTVKSYVFLLLTILRFDRKNNINAEDDAEDVAEDVAEDDALTDRERELMLSKILSIWNNTEVDMDEVLDDTLLRIMSRVRALRAQMAENTTIKSCPSVFDGEGLEFLKNTKIGALADEIARDVDMTSLAGLKPEDILSGTADMNSLGSIFSSVGATIQNKLQSGELNQDELLQEAIGFAGNLNTSGHGDVMSKMMQMMSEGTLGDIPQIPESHGADDSAVRDRLRKKLQQRKTGAVN